IDWRTSLLLEPRLPANQLISFWPSCMTLTMLALNLPRSGLVQHPDAEDGSLGCLQSQSSPARF
ncbi:hypothetical protein KBY93_10065, partial [Synechococcus sp. J7-Johnson]|uniref:hypothetical protein n=1 Tax=Synechococcus sp. J7-Johnson TaxID=2823737 RepID=UPI0020CCC996